MKHLLPVVLLALTLAGCGPKKGAHYAPMVSAVEIPVFDDDETNKVMAIYARHHNDTLAAMDLLNRGNIEDAVRKIKESNEDTSLYPRMIDMVKTLGDNPSEFAKFQEYMRKIGEESDILMKNFAEKNPEIAAQADAIIKALLSEENTPD
ncbi:MAG: hypothetical protein LBC18_05875 [Opitutaceae bacterium]|jgi:hypothetical protein|nr:hypothetical protein [Opitutaceae bacterium]